MQVQNQTQAFRLEKDAHSGSATWLVRVAIAGLLSAQLAIPPQILADTAADRSRLLDAYRRCVTQFEPTTRGDPIDTAATKISEHCRNREREMLSGLGTREAEKLQRHLKQLDRKVAADARVTRNRTPRVFDSADDLSAASEL